MSCLLGQPMAALRTEHGPNALAYPTAAIGARRVLGAEDIVLQIRLGLVREGAVKQALSARSAREAARVEVATSRVNPLRVLRNVLSAPATRMAGGMPATTVLIVLHCRVVEGDLIEQ